MFEQIERDALAGRFALWGVSTVVDENVGVPVIDRVTFDRLHTAAGIAAEWPLGNAGLIHVYGYLLSTVETPYGLKRERWEGGALARTFGLSASAFLLADAAAAGETVLQRVTEVVRRPLEAPQARNGAILVFDDALPADPGTVFRTVIVRRTPDEPAALVYGVREGDRMLAITTFPLASVTPASLAALEDEVPRMRYNAALPSGASGSVCLRSPLVRVAVSRVAD